MGEHARHIVVAGFLNVGDPIAIAKIRNSQIPCHGIAGFGPFREIDQRRAVVAKRPVQIAILVIQAGYHQSAIGAFTVAGMTF